MLRKEPRLVALSVEVLPAMMLSEPMLTAGGLAGILVIYMVLGCPRYNPSSRRRRRRKQQNDLNSYELDIFPPISRLFGTG